MVDPSSGDTGSGSRLPASLLNVSLACTVFATVLSFWSIFLHWKSYRRIALQRLVVRIIVMIPLYAIASLVSLHSLDAAYWIDAIRDLYEAFVIYTFFQLMVTYLGGERSLLILLHGRTPVHHVWPVSIFIQELDCSDPYTFLGLKRGILQYVYVKPVLAVITLILKSNQSYSDGNLSFNTGYTYVAVFYNISICTSLYCLAMFWVVVNNDLHPFRPMPKFLCVKGILFFSFWQGIFVSFLVKVGAIRHVGVYTDPEHMSLAIGDVLICLEMPIFAIAHTYAFCKLSDYVDPKFEYVARLRVGSAFKDSIGVLDLYYDFRATLSGGGISYRGFEPAETSVQVHSIGKARERRIRAGLRYTGGGKGGKYWVQTPTSHEERDTAISRGYGSLSDTIKDGAHHAYQNALAVGPLKLEGEDSDESLEFEDVEEKDEELFEEAKGYLHGDWGYNVIDVSKEEAKRRMRIEEDNVLKGWGRRGEGKPGFKGKGKPKRGTYGNYSTPTSGYSDRSPFDASGSPISSGSNHQQSNDNIPHVESPYDGDVEREDAWRAPADAESSKLQWTARSKRTRAGSIPKIIKEHVQEVIDVIKPKYELGFEDEDEEDEENARKTPSPLPDDCVDIVGDKDLAGERDRRKTQAAAETDRIIRDLQVAGGQNGHHYIDKPSQSPLFSPLPTTTTHNNDNPWS